MASLADQLGWCITTKDHLNNLNSELKYVAQYYNDGIDNLKSWGYFEEKLPHLEQLSNDFEQEINELIGYIENDHLEYVDRQSQAILAQLPGVQKHSARTGN
jgi:hypothetical protein